MTESQSARSAGRHQNCPGTPDRCTSPCVTSPNNKCGTGFESAVRTSRCSRYWASFRPGKPYSQRAYRECSCRGSPHSQEFTPVHCPLLTVLIHQWSSTAGTWACRVRSRIARIPRTRVLAPAIPSIPLRISRPSGEIWSSRRTATRLPRIIHSARSEFRISANRRGCEWIRRAVVLRENFAPWSPGGCAAHSARCCHNRARARDPEHGRVSRSSER